MSPTLRHPDRGYTLIELLVVVAVLGICAAMVVPAMLQTGQMTIQAAARRIVTDVLLAQNEAVASAATRKVIVDVANNCYSITDINNTPIVKPWMSGNYTVDFDKDKRFTGVRIETASFGGQTTESFDELGAPAAGGTIEISSQGHRYKITVAAFTGRVTVAPMNGG